MGRKMPFVCFVNQQKRQVLNLYLQGKTFGKRPSEILGIDDEWLAYEFDTCCYRLGVFVENEIAKGKKKKVTSETVLKNLEAAERRTTSKAQYMNWANWKE